MTDKNYKSVEIEGVRYHIREGDLLLTDADLKKYEAGGQANAPVSETLDPHELLGMTIGGKLVRWRVGLKLSYSIRKSTFTTDAEYKTVRDAMKAATDDWEKTCGVEFERREPDTNGALFVVERVDTDGEFIAAAFFPDWPKERRRVMIDPSYFKTSFDKVGVLRHELGHVLGFRHEHIRLEAPPDCPGEQTQGTFDLSPYDPKSVMHYFCGGVGDKNLPITDLDRAAAQRLYGPAIKDLVYFE